MSSSHLKNERERTLGQCRRRGGTGWVCEDSLEPCVEIGSSSNVVVEKLETASEKGETLSVLVFEVSGEGNSHRVGLLLSDTDDLGGELLVEVKRLLARDGVSSDQRVDVLDCTARERKESV